MKAPACLPGPFYKDPNFISCFFAEEIPVFPAPCGGGEHKKELGDNYIHLLKFGSVIGLRVKFRCMETYNFWQISPRL